MSIRNWLLPQCGPSNLSTPVGPILSKSISGQNCSTPILDIKERHKPHGLAAFDRFGTSVWSLELAEEYGFSLVEASFEEQQDSELHLRQALSRLEPQERQAIVLYLDGKRPVRRAEKCSFQTALDKLRDYYLAVQYAPQANQ